MSPGYSPLTITAPGDHGDIPFRSSNRGEAMHSSLTGVMPCSRFPLYVPKCARHAPFTAISDIRSVTSHPALLSSPSALKLAPFWPNCITNRCKVTLEPIRSTIAQKRRISRCHHHRPINPALTPSPQRRPATADNLESRDPTEPYDTT